MASHLAYRPLSADQNIQEMFANFQVDNENTSIDALSQMLATDYNCVSLRPTKREDGKIVW